jgi:5'-AMP-activated protein kinase, regulatory gamma subunit
MTAVTLLISPQCTRDIQSLHLPLRKLGVGTYVHRDPSEGEPEPGQNPYHPIATATMSTTVFDVVHMFSERGISAVPIIDENGVVVNLYETVDVIVSTLPVHFTLQIEYSRRL